MPDEADAQAEIAAILARLQHEVRSCTATSAAETDYVHRARLAARSRAEQVWAVSAERPFEQTPNRLRNYLFAPVKRMLRKLIRWHVEPAASQQRSLNLAVPGLVGVLAQRVEVDASRFERRIRALEGRVMPNRAGPSA